MEEAPTYEVFRRHNSEKVGRLVARRAIKGMDYQELREAFSQVAKPSEVKGDFISMRVSDEHINRLIASDPDSLTERDFEGYVGEVVSYEPGGPDHYVYLLPTMLRIWAECLCESETAFNAYLNCDLAREKILDSYLSPELRNAVTKFMCSALSRRIAKEDSLRVTGASQSHEWCDQLNSFGVISSSLPELWSTVWDVAEAGHACAVVQFASCLVFKGEQNPIFDTWTPYLGGGPFELWEYDSMGFDECWLPSNVKFLRETLSVPYLFDRLARISQLYPNSPLQRKAWSIWTGVKLHSQRVDERCTALASALESPSDDDFIDWSTFGAH